MANLNLQQYDPLAGVLAQRGIMPPNPAIAGALSPNMRNFVPSAPVNPSMAMPPLAMGGAPLAPGQSAPAAAMQPAVGSNTRDLLAKTIAAEAGNQSFEGKIAVGSVIKNRAASGKYGKGIDGVIMKPGQFSAWNSVTGYAGGEQGQNMDAITPSAEDYAAADAVLKGEAPDPTGGATHYYNPSISNPKWGKGAGGSWSKIGDHIFGFADGRPGAGSEVVTGGEGGDTLSTYPEPNAGTPAPAPTTERKSIIQQLTGGVKSMFMPQDFDNPRLASESAGRKSERFSKMADAIDAQMSNTNAPISWGSVLAKGLSTYGDISNSRKAAAGEAQAQQQLTELLASGKNDPQTLALISALSPELGQQIMRDERGYAHDNANREDSQLHDIDLQNAANTYDQNATQAGWEREDANTAAANAREDARVAADNELAIANREDNQLHDIDLANLNNSAKTPTDTRTPEQKIADDLFPNDPAARRDWLLSQTANENSPEVLAAQAADLIAGNKKWGDGLATTASERHDAMMVTANTAPQQLANLDRMDQALSRAVLGIAGGGAATVGEALAWFGIRPDQMPEGVANIMREFGLTSEQAASAQVLEAIANEATTGMIGTEGFPANNFSDADRAFLQRIFPAITDTQAGAFEKLGNLKVRYELNAMKRDEWLNYRAQNGDTRESFEEFEREWSQKQTELAPQMMQEYAYDLIEESDTTNQIAHIKTDEEYEALPSGARYRDPEDNQLYRKP